MQSAGAAWIDGSRQCTVGVQDGGYRGGSERRGTPRTVGVRSWADGDLAILTRVLARPSQAGDRRLGLERGAKEDGGKGGELELAALLDAFMRNALDDVARRQRQAAAVLIRTAFVLPTALFAGARVSEGPVLVGSLGKALRAQCRLRPKRGSPDDNRRPGVAPVYGIQPTGWVRTGAMSLDTRLRQETQAFTEGC